MQEKADWMELKLDAREQLKEIVLGVVLLVLAALRRIY